jgi:hypothetical protein
VLGHAVQSLNSRLHWLQLAADQQQLQLLLLCAQALSDNLK